jgi:hypothetical protein
MSSEQFTFEIYHWESGSFVGAPYTGSVLSFAGKSGRTSYMDNYAGGGFTITIANNDNEAAQFVRGYWVDILFGNGDYLQGGQVSEIVYDDYVGQNQGLSTATITCLDSLAVSGKFQLQNFTFTQATTGNQAAQVLGTYGPEQIPQIQLDTTSLSTASASTYSGTYLNRLNLLANTEKGQIWQFGDWSLRWKSRQNVSASSGKTFTRTSGGASDITYIGFRRIALGEQFFNQVTVTPEGLTEQKVTNSSSVDLYGASGFQMNSVDYNTTQASGLASWLATMLANPTDYRYEVDISDITGNKENIRDFLNIADIANYPTATLKWLKPGDVSETTVNVVCEGFSFNAVPGQTTYTVYFSPLTNYQYFTLNSSTLGILDTSRLGW